MKISVMFPLMPGQMAELIPFAELVRDSTASRLWQGQSLHIETHQSFAYLAGKGLTLPTGISVTLAPLRHPYEAAVQGQSLSRLTGHGVVLGIGTGSQEFIDGIYGDNPPAPLTVAREYLTIARRLLDGGDLDFTGEHYTMHGGLPRMEGTAVEVGLGVLRPGMARVAGQVADVGITWLAPVDYLREQILPAMRAGAQRAGRDAPRCVSVVHAAVAREGRNPYRCALTAARQHLSAPHYADMLRQAGLVTHHSQPLLGARALVDSGTFAFGSAEDIARVLEQYDRGGVDEVVLNPAGVLLTEGTEAALADLVEIVAAVTAPQRSFVSV